MDDVSTRPPLKLERYEEALRARRAPISKFEGKWLPFRLVALGVGLLAFVTAEILRGGSSRHWLSFIGGANSVFLSFEISRIWKALRSERERR